MHQAKNYSNFIIWKTFISIPGSFQTTMCSFSYIYIYIYIYVEMRSDRNNNTHIFLKTGILKIPQYSLKNTCVEVSF